MENVPNLGTGSLQAYLEEALVPAEVRGQFRETFHVLPRLSLLPETLAVLSLNHEGYLGSFVEEDGVYILVARAARQ